MNKPRPIDYPFAIPANLLVVAVGVYAWTLFAADPDLYYLSMQEDEYLEWASFWAFFWAGVICLRKALMPRFELSASWFLTALGAFCLFVAMEEISWGQRIIGYRPPAYFLELNYQQELNIHNIVHTDLRMLGLQATIFGYGVILPVAGFLPYVGRTLRRIGVIAPPAALIPSFLLTGIAHIAYPVKFTGEWVELMLALCFLFSALSTHRPDSSDSRHGKTPGPGQAVAVWLAVMTVGVASATTTRHLRDADPANVEAARKELDALRRDLLARESRCGLHKRLYTLAHLYDRQDLLTGEYSQLTRQGMPEQRATYLLDPWNYAYWLRDNCATEQHPRTTYLYSFGPNRRRDSTKWRLGGDDIAMFVRGEP